MDKTPATVTASETDDAATFKVVLEIEATTQVESSGQDAPDSDSARRTVERRDRGSLQTEQAGELSPRQYDNLAQCSPGARESTERSGGP
jgi:hypothetical protein